MEKINFSEFEDAFFRFLQTNSAAVEQMVKEISAKAKHLEIKIGSCEEKSEIIAQPGECSIVDCRALQEFRISGKSDAGLRIFCEDLPSELIIDLQHESILYESPCQVPLCFRKIDSERIQDGDIFLIGTHYLIFTLSNTQTLQLQLTQDFGNPKQTFQLSSPNSKHITINNTHTINPLTLGRTKSSTQIQIDEESVSRTHAELLFTTHWTLTDKNSKYGTFKSLHTLKTLSSISKPFVPLQSSLLKFNGVTLELIFSY